MAGSSSKGSSRFIFGALLLGGICGAGWIGWQQGWISPALWQGDQNLTADADFDAFDDVPPPPLEAELPDDIAEAQFEPPIDDEAAEDGEMPGRATIEGDELVNEDSADSGIQQANFEEEEAPPVPEKTAARTREVKPASRRSEAADEEIPGPLEPTKSSARKQPLMELKAIEALEEEGDYISAQQELSKWYWQKPDAREKLLPRLNRLAQALYFAPQPNYYEPYVIKPGDQLRVVGQRYKLSWEYLAKLNHVDARKIRMGQKLKVVPGPFAAVVSISRYELVIHQGGSFVKSYRVGVGKDGTTPIGTFAVKNKMVDPTYYGPDGVISHDDPENPLGERWIDLGDSYGIHGTIEPKSIGKNESRGCVRMLNEDVEEVYDFLVLGSEVQIQP